ncbi:MAG: hypothetical protein WB558_07820 [Terriglobales bacterium]
MTERRKGERSPQNQGLTEETLLDGELERAAFEKLTRLGVPRDRLLSLVLWIPHASSKKEPLVAGMDERTVRALPSRIVSLAGDIEKVNKSATLDLGFLPKLAKAVRTPAGLPAPLDSIVTGGSSEETAYYFSTIANVLRFYADYLRARLEYFHPKGLRRRKMGRPLPVAPRTWSTLDLLELVRTSTQKARYGEIATLLDAAFRAIGEPITIDVEYLKKLKTNNPWPDSVVRKRYLRSNDRDAPIPNKTLTLTR